MPCDNNINIFCNIKCIERLATQFSQKTKTATCIIAFLSKLLKFLFTELQTKTFHSNSSSINISSLQVSKALNTRQSIYLVRYYMYNSCKMCIYYWTHWLSYRKIHTYNWAHLNFLYLNLCYKSDWEIYSRAKSTVNWTSHKKILRQFGLMHERQLSVCHESQLSVFYYCLECKDMLLWVS